MPRLGRVKVTSLHDGFFALDGGSMFGIVPRVVWSRIAPPDEANRIRLALNVTLIEVGGKKILCDVGLGDRPDPDFRGRYLIDKSSNLPDSLMKIGLTPQDIDFVVPSHLHWDHAGWCTRRVAGGGYEPMFPKATYVVQEGGWEEAVSDNPRTKGSYVQSDFLAVEKRLKLVKGTEEILPGVAVMRTGGHVKHHQVLLARTDGKTFFFAGDVFPTSWHIKPAWTLGFDLFPAEMAALKEEWLPRIQQEEWLCAFVHDPKAPLGYIRDGHRVERAE